MIMAMTFDLLRATNEEKPEISQLYIVPADRVEEFKQSLRAELGCIPIRFEAIKRYASMSEFANDTSSNEPAIAFCWSQPDSAEGDQTWQ